MPRIGVLGGTFDPVHIGHLLAAVEVRAALDLAVVLLVVANDPWQKAGRVRAAAADRLAVVEAAVDGIDGVEASDLEIARGGPTYTADTLAALRTLHPGAALSLVLGADVVPLLHTWERAEEVRLSARLAIVNRPGAPDPVVPAGWEADVVEIPALEVSSSDIRRRLGAGRTADVLLPVAAVREIRSRGLYARA